MQNYVKNFKETNPLQSISACKCVSRLQQRGFLRNSPLGTTAPQAAAAPTVSLLGQACVRARVHAKDAGTQVWQAQRRDAGAALTAISKGRRHSSSLSRTEKLKKRGVLRNNC